MTNLLLSSNLHLDLMLKYLTGLMNLSDVKLVYEINNSNPLKFVV